MEWFIHLEEPLGKKQADDEFLLVRKDTNVECDDFRVILEKNCSR